MEVGQRINITFLYFDIERADSCIYDYIQIDEGIYCGYSDNPVTIISITNSVDIRFKSDSSEQRDGFIAVWGPTT